MAGIFVKGLYTLAVILAYAYGQRELDIEVYGDSVVQTDIITYTIYTGNVYGTKSVTIKCIALVSLPSILLLLRNNDVLGHSSIDGYNTYAEVTEILRYNRYNMWSLSGIYVCRINFTIPVDGVMSSIFEYEMESKLTIETEESTICASSIGYSSYVGESGNMSCVPYYYYRFYEYDRRLSGATDNSHPFGFTIWPNYNSFRIRCKYNRNAYRSSYRDYESQYFIIYRFLDVKLSRSNYTDNSSAIEFICRSIPPRLMYWEIIGKNGNILDLYRLNKSAYIDGYISIQHSVGNTSIRISRSIYLKQDIHTVLCSTYDTRARAMAYASLRLVDTCECEENIYTSPPYDQTSQEDLGSTATYGIILNETRLQTTESVAPSLAGVTPISKEAVKLEQLTVRCNILIGAVALLLTIIFILIVVICYTIHRLKKRSDMENDLKGTDLEGPELHNNPVYLAFSEPSDSAHSARDEENELNYANL